MTPAVAEHLGHGAGTDGRNHQRPRVHEDHLHVEGEKQHRDRVPAHVELAHRVLSRRKPARERHRRRRRAGDRQQPPRRVQLGEDERHHPGRASAATNPLTSTRPLYEHMARGCPLRARIRPAAGRRRRAGASRTPPGRPSSRNQTRPPVRSGPPAESSQITTRMAARRESGMTRFRRGRAGIPCLLGLAHSRDRLPGRRNRRYRRPPLVAGHFIG